MGVTLRVVGPNSQILGDQATKVFTDGGRIGRGEHNDWVLPDANRFISSEHAEVVTRADGAYLVDKSINGTYVNAHDQPIGHGNSHRLQEGDRIRIGEYDIIVSLTVGRPASGGDVWPAADPERTPTPPLPPEPGFAEPGLVSGESVDPLDHLDGSSPDPDPFAGQPGGGMLHGPPSPGFGSYATPQPRSDPVAPDPFGPGPGGGPPQSDPFPEAPGSAGVIPEDWDKTTMPSQPGRQPAEPPPSPPGPPGGADPFPREAGGSPFPAGNAQAGVDPTPGGDAEPGSAPSVRNRPPPPNPPPASPPASPPPPAGAGDLEELFQAAGLDPATARTVASPENSQVLGMVLKLVVQGMMEILSARAQIKNQFRVSMTQIRPVENNPLKFCVSPEDALQRLFVQHSPGFLGPTEAFAEAVEDIKAHQMAMMAGMRAAFDQLMARFDPENLQKEFDRSLRRSTLLQPLNKNKYWDMLAELYEEINRDGDANFSRLFGDEFARAYEAQMERFGRER